MIKLKRKLKQKTNKNTINNCNKQSINKRNKITPYIFQKQQNTVNTVHTHNPKSDLIKHISSVNGDSGRL